MRLYVEGGSAGQCLPPSPATSGSGWLGKKSEAGVVQDFFWPGLLIIPIRVRGRVAGLTARNLEGYPKFVHLAGTRVHFGLDTLHGDVAVVVEGPFDALAVERFGHPAVALLGTAMDAALTDKLKSFKKVFVALDADAAGRGSAIDVAKAIGARARIVVLPDGDDPDEVTRAVFDAALSTARDLVGHRLLAMPVGIEPTEIVSWIEDAGLIESLAAEDDLRRDAHIDEITTKLDFGRAKAQQFRSAFKKRLKEVEKQRDDDVDVENEQRSAQFLKLDDGRLADVVLSTDGRRPVWAVFDPGSGEVGLREALTVDEHDIAPQSGPEALGWNAADPFHPESGRAVLLHGAPIDFGTEAALFAEVRAFIAKYFNESDENWLTLYAAYVLLTWAVEIASECPYLSWTGGAGSGKSRAMLAVGLICRRPMILSAGSSAAALRRTIDRWRGTVIADEGLLNDKTEAGQAVLGILLAGFSRRTAMIMVCEGDDNTPRGYYTFGAKLFTGQIDWRDPGARSRTLTRTLSADNRKPHQPVDLPPGFDAEANLLRRKLQMWRFRALAAWGPCSVAEPEEQRLLEGVPSRAQQVFLPLLRSVRDGEIRRDLIGVAKVHATALLEAKKQRLEAKLLQALADVMHDTGGRVLRVAPRERVYVKQIRERMISHAVASGLDATAATKSTPEPTALGRVLNSTLCVETRSGRDGAFVLLDSEAQFAKAEAAMTSFGVEIPWPIPSREVGEVGEVQSRGVAPAVCDTPSGRMDASNSRGAPPPVTLTNITNLTSSQGVEPGWAPEASAAQGRTRRGTAGIEGPGYDRPLGGVPASGPTRPSLESPCSDSPVRFEVPARVNPTEPHIRHQRREDANDRWDALCRAVTVMELDGGISPPDCDAPLAAAVAACVREDDPIAILEAAP